MPGPTTVAGLAARFQRRMDLLDATTNSANRANRARRLNRQALGSLYEGAMLSLAKSLETFLEDYFLLLLHSPSARGEVQSSTAIVEPSSRGEVDALFDLDNSYLDWLPFQRTQERADRFFPNGSPFSRLARASQEKETLRVHHVVRNAVAHESGTAVRKFHGLDQVKNVPGRAPSVADFLRWVDPVSGLENWATHRNNISAIVQALTAPDDAAARAFIGPEIPFSVEDTPGAGTYRCNKCSKQVRLPYAGSQLRPCRACGVGKKGKPQYDRVW